MNEQHIAILDPSCRARTGHHYSLNKMIVELAAQTGKKTSVFVNRECEPEILREISGEPIFDTSVYVKFESRPDGKTIISAINILNHQIFKELMMSAAKFASADRIIVTTANQWILLGLYWWAEKALRKDQQLDIILMFPPYYPLGNGYRKVLDDYYNNVFGLWNKLGKQHRFISEADSITDAYLKLGAAPVETCPIPIFVDPEWEDEGPREGPLRFLFAGDARGEKGSGLLSEAIERLDNEGLEFEVFLQNLKFAPNSLVKALQSGASRFKLLELEAYGEEFVRLLQTSDVTLVPYDPRLYANRTSHIFVESMGCGRPVLTTAGTWMCDELRKLNAICGEIHNFDARSLSRAMRKMIERKDEIRRSASIIRREVLAKHGHIKFKEFMFDGN